VVSLNGWLSSPHVIARTLYCSAALRKAGSIAGCGRRIGGSDWFCLPAYANGFVQDHQFVGRGLLQYGG
jgi:hypothetical protein